MPVIINGTTGIDNSNGGYTGDGISFADGTPANTLVTTTGGNVGIGTSSPAAKLHVSNNSFTVALLETTAASSDNVQLRFKGVSGERWAIGNNIAAGGTGLNFDFYDLVAGANRVRITSDGNLLIGTTGTGGSAGAVMHAARGGTVWNFGPAVVGSGNNFYVLNGSGTGVYLVSGQTSWTANSDERLKTDIVPITNAAEKVASLRAVTGRYLVDPEGTSRAFLIAQDVQKVLPEAVNVQNDEQGTLGLQYTDTIPLLVAAIKELKSELDSVKAELATLKAGA